MYGLYYTLKLWTCYYEIPLDFAFLVDFSFSFLRDIGLLELIAPNQTPEKFMLYLNDLVNSFYNWSISWIKYLIYSSFIIVIKLIAIYCLTKLLTYGMKDPHLFYSEIGWCSLFLELAFPDFMLTVATLYYGLLFLEWMCKY